MKALSIIEPYASLIAEGKKHIETRSWRTSYRGPLLIHASATRIPKEYTHLLNDVQNVHPGHIICCANLIDCVQMTEEFIRSLSEQEIKYGFYSVGRWAWILDDVKPIEPYKIKGHLGIWEVQS